MEKVRVRLRGRQKDADGKVERIEMTAEGEYTIKAGKHYVKYLDSSIDPDNPVSTVLKVSDDSLTIIRQGAVGGTQKFALGREDRSAYHTPYGELELNIKTTRLNISFTETAGEVDFAYDVAVNGEFTGHNKLIINIEKI